MEKLVRKIGLVAHDAMKIERLLVNNPREVKFEDAVNIFKAAY